MTLSFIDVIFLIIMLIFAVAACAKGFIRELFGKLAVIAGLVAAFLLCGRLEPYLVKAIDNKLLDTVIAFFLIFVVVFLAVKIIQTLVGSLFSGEILRGLDRVLGFAFGALEGLFVVCCLLVLMNAQPWFDFTGTLDSSTFWRILSPFLAEPVKHLRGVFA